MYFSMSMMLCVCKVCCLFSDRNAIYIQFFFENFVLSSNTYYKKYGHFQNTDPRQIFGVKMEEKLDVAAYTVPPFWDSF